MEQIVCPQCHSDQITAGKKGVGTGRAALGYFTSGAGMGLTLGMMGSNKVVITCLKCGNQFPSGAGAIKTTDENGNVSIVEQVYVDKDKKAGKTIALIGLVILAIMAFAIWMFFATL